MGEILNCIRLATVVLGTSLTAVVLVSLCATLSTLLVFALKASIIILVKIITVGGEILVALIAALTSGITVTLTVIVSAGAAAMTFPASSIEARIGLSVAVSSAAVVVCAAVVIFVASLNITWEVASAVVSAAAMSVAFAAAWAVGVMSLIEKETQQVGIKMTSILDAVRNNNHRILRILLKLQTGTKKQTDLNLALLHAVKAGFSECTETLLLSGADADTRDSHDNTPLVIACESGTQCHAIAKILLSHGANVDMKGGCRGAALHLAAKWGNEDCVDLLLSNHANPNLLDSQWRTPLMLAAQYAPEADKIIRMLISAGADVNTLGYQDKTAIHYAASRGLDVQILLEAGADPDTQDSDGNTALHLSSREGHTAVVHHLLDIGCSPNMKNRQRRTPAHFAAIKGETTCLRLLAEKDDILTNTDTMGQWPMWCASHGGHLEAVIFLVQQHCVTATDAPFETLQSPLVTALEQCHLAVAHVLLLAYCPVTGLSNWLTEIPPDQWFEDAQVEHLLWLREFSYTTSSLMHQCRGVIRNALKSSLHRKIDKLPLPLTLRRYITMEELNHWQQLYDTSNSQMSVYKPRAMSLRCY